jgi:hypothetical protein
MQMSASRAFILVEGRDTDVFFYDEICRPVCEAASVPYDVVRADRVSTGGGKSALLDLYSFLKAKHSLINCWKGVPKVCIFYLDKDVDDVLKSTLHSLHIVYTPSYNVENLLFALADLVRAAAASSLAASHLQPRIVDSAAWTRRVADLWKDFVTLCLFSLKHRANCDCTYACSTSPLNLPPDAPAIPAEIDARKAQVRQLLGLSEPQFERLYGAASRLVERIYRAGRHDVIFNGKWYRAAMIREIQLAAGSAYKPHALSNSIMAALRATLDFSGTWADHFRRPLQELLVISVTAPPNS